LVFFKFWGCCCILFYVLVEVVPKKKSDQEVRGVLDSAVASMVEGLLRGGVFQHEKELQYVNLNLREVEWQKEIDLCGGRDFIRLKFAEEQLKLDLITLRG